MANRSTPDILNTSSSSNTMRGPTHPEHKPIFVDLHIHETITHPFFPDSVFLFLLSPDHPCTYCDACGRDIKGYNYHCFEKGLDLHPSCAKIPNTIFEGGLTLKLQKKASSKCYRCDKKELREDRKSWAYTCKDCQLHIACVKDMLLENWEKECLGDGNGNREALAKREPRLEIVLDKGKRSIGKKFTKCKKIVKIALTFIMAAVVGDPTAMVIALITSLLAH